MMKKAAMLMLLTLSASASAADLSKTVWSFISGSSRQQPMMQDNKDGTVEKVWMMPEGLQAEGAIFIYMPKLSTNHWALVMAGAQLPASDYFGTAQWTPAETIKDAKDPSFVMHFNRLGGGMYKGLYMMDETVNGRGQQARMLMLVTPQMYAVMKKNRHLEDSIRH